PAADRLRAGRTPPAAPCGAARHAAPAPAWRHRASGDAAAAAGLARAVSLAAASGDAAMSPVRLDVRDLHLAYGQAVVLRGGDLRVHGGELLGLIGPNGSGKSSLLRACTGTLECRGELAVDGIDPRREPLAARSRLGYAVDPATLPGALRGRQCI